MLALCMLVTHAAVRADTLVGEVVAVADGDTLTILDERQAQRIVRLAGIDAPEKGQPYGAAARRQLQQLALKRTARVEFKK